MGDARGVKRMFNTSVDAACLERAVGDDRGVIEPAVELCVLLWAHPGRVGDLVAYEDHVLQLLAVHGATLVTRVRTVEPSESLA